MCNRRSLNLQSTISKKKQLMLNVHICKCIEKKLPCSSIFVSFQRVKITTLIFLALGNGIHHGIKFCTENKNKPIFNPYL